MRKISTEKISATLEKLCLEANTTISKDVELALKKAWQRETLPRAKNILGQILKNINLAKKSSLPLCQDTGTAIVFIELGQNVQLAGTALKQAINQGISRGYRQGYLRKSQAADPLERGNTGDNTPAIIHTEIVPGNKLKLTLFCKGGGAENKSAIKMFKPTTPWREIEAFILETVRLAGPDACPPLIVGIGIGGNFDKAPLLAKKALLRKVGTLNRERKTALLEKALLQKINKLGIGPMGLGGKTTALAVQIEKAPCHISSLPIAINLECHAHRVKRAVF